MPNCFQLIRKDNPQAGPVKLQDVDAEMCQHFGVPCDEKRWYLGWFDTIGFSLAMGKSFDDIIEQIKKEMIADDSEESRKYFQKELDLAEWMKANYDSNAFYSHK